MSVTKAVLRKSQSWAVNGNLPFDQKFLNSPDKCRLRCAMSDKLKKEVEQLRAEVARLTTELEHAKWANQRITILKKRIDELTANQRKRSAAKNLVAKSIIVRSDDSD
jgi:hypothetical protein